MKSQQVELEIFLSVVPEHAQETPEYLDALDVGVLDHAPENALEVLLGYTL